MKKTETGKTLLHLYSHLCSTVRLKGHSSHCIHDFSADCKLLALENVRERCDMFNDCEDPLPPFDSAVFALPY